MTTPKWWSDPLTPEGIAVVQRKLGAEVTGVWDDDTEARVRGLQMARKRKPTGEVDEQTAEDLGEEATVGMTPEWFTGDLALGDISPAVHKVRCRLGVPHKGDDRFDPDVEKAVRRFQSGHQLPVTGVVDEATAVALGECVCEWSQSTEGVRQ